MFSFHATQGIDLSVATILTHDVILVKLETVAPVDPSEVGRAQLENVQLEGLLHEHDVVLRHAEAVEVAWVQRGAERH